MSIARYHRPGAKASLMAGKRVAWIENSPRASYLRACVLSAPPWVDRWELEALRAWAAARTAFEGQQYVLDHIVPVTHPRVSGLTVPWNLRVVHWLVNAAKGNRWNPDQMGLFG